MKKFFISLFTALTLACGTISVSAKTYTTEEITDAVSKAKTLVSLIKVVDNYQTVATKYFIHLSEALVKFTQDGSLSHFELDEETYLEISNVHNSLVKILGNDNTIIKSNEVTHILPRIISFQNHLIEENNKTSSDYLMQLVDIIESEILE